MSRVCGLGLRHRGVAAGFRVDTKVNGIQQLLVSLVREILCS